MWERKYLYWGVILVYRRSLEIHTKVGILKRYLGVFITIIN
ncbi:hypothetical protein CHITON_0735 [Thermococcus chitonophagus]|uniref:Uncharacterized protein n=1 Tax=Thermococcus chitonophagus TaxID=54262 RepID=A0A161JXH6_9EURY|nr:hypothetical protein CHITON_0735 [Thermococcus chitonophagus]